MTNLELSRVVADKSLVTIQKSSAVIKAFITLIKSEVDTKGEIQVNGLGKFSKKDYPERKGVNPATGEKIIIPARSKVVFKPSKEFTDLINKK